MAISLAGVLKDLELGKVGEDSTIVCTLTGQGLKDPDTAIAQSAKPLRAWKSGVISGFTRLSGKS